MKRLILALCILLIASNAIAEEIDGEVSVSLIDPYKKFIPGFSISFRPDILSWDRMSFGAGVSLYVSSRFNYETTNWIWYAKGYYDPDSTDWYYYDENLVELANYEIFTESRFRFLGKSEDDHWKGWLSLNLGVVDHASARTTFTTIAEQREYVDTLGVTQYEVLQTDRYSVDYNTVHKQSFYAAPGLMIGIGNFFAAYKHWIYFDSRDLIDGEPSQTLGTIRVGYRFLW